MASSKKRKGKKTNHKSPNRSNTSCNQQQVSLNVTNRDTEGVVDSLEKTLFDKVELQYAIAWQKLLALNYVNEVAFKAMKTNGCIYGPSIAIFDNIVRNTISYLETGNVIDKNLCSNEGGEPKPIMNMKELVTYSMHALIEKVGKNQPKSEVIKLLLLDNRFFECEVVENETKRLINESSDALTMDLNIINADIKSSIAANQLCQSENQSKSRLVKKKQQKILKKNSDTEKKVFELKRQIEEREHEIAQIEENVLQAAEAEKQAKEGEVKKQARLHFIEEDRLNRKGKQELGSHVVTVQQELDDANKQQQQRYVATLPASSSAHDLMMDVKKRTIKHLCIICHTNNANVLFLPCKHEVICQHCNDINVFDSSLMAAGCPCCKFGIE